MFLTIDAGVMPCVALYVLLDAAAAIGLVHRLPHRVGDVIGVENGPPAHVPRGAAHRLDQRARRSQESFFVRVEDRDEGDFRQIEPLPEQVDADEHVERPQPQVPQNLDPLERVDIGMQVADPDAQLLVVLREVFRHAFREGRHQHALARGRPPAGFPPAGRQFAPSPAARRGPDRPARWDG